MHNPMVPTNGIRLIRKALGLSLGLRPRRDLSKKRKLKTERTKKGGGRLLHWQYNQEVKMSRSNVR